MSVTLIVNNDLSVSIDVSDKNGNIPAGTSIPNNTDGKQYSINLPDTLTISPTSAVTFDCKLEYGGRCTVVHSGTIPLSASAGMVDGNGGPNVTVGTDQNCPG
ncbi:MAG: hypothetical protein PVH61_31890 [Candidatus Aminicenantes bacterium]|jgi:hypothetical protein